MTNMLEAALGYAYKGKPVFPVSANKRPKTKRGLNEATTDEAQIIRWWEMWPAAGIGLRTGSPSNFIVLDVDGLEGLEALADLECHHEQLPETCVAATPRGGYHYYFTRLSGVPIHNSAGKLGKGLDIRGDGGYVLVPPSQTINGAYTWNHEVAPVPLPQWLHLLLVKREDEVEDATPVEAWITMLDGMVVHGARNDSLTRLAGHLLRKTVDYEVTRRLIHIFNFMRCVPPLPRDEVERTLQSIHEIELRRRRDHDEPDTAETSANPYQVHATRVAGRT